MFLDTHLVNHLIGNVRLQIKNLLGLPRLLFLLSCPDLVNFKSLIVEQPAYFLKNLRHI